MVPFSPPRIDQKVIDEVTAALKSGWITTGPRTKKFEVELTNYCGNKKTLCVNSATAGLELMLRWFGVKEGDEVIIPAYTYCATANVVVHCGAKPVMVDSNPNDFNIAVEAVRKAITPKTKAIIPVDFGGWPCDYEAIKQLVNNVEVREMFQPESENQEKLGRILVLADAAHSLGAEYHGRKSGSLTDISVFSFHAVKNLTTAEGGAIALNLPEVFDHDELYKYLNTISLHGQSKDALAKSQKGGWRYDVIEAGYKCNMTDIQAAIGLVELERYERETLPKRESVCEKYTQAFEPYNWAQLPVFKSDSRNSSYHLFPLRIKNISEQQRNRIIQKISEKDVAVNVHFVPLPLHSFYKKQGYTMDQLPVALDNYSREISLPVFYDITEEQVNEVVDALVGAVENQ